MASILLPDSEKALLLIKGALGPSQVAQAFPSTYGERISSTVSALTEASARITEVQIVLTPSQATRPPASLGLNDTQAVISTIQLIQGQIASATTAGCCRTPITNVSCCWTISCNSINCFGYLHSNNINYTAIVKKDLTYMHFYS